MRRLEEHRLEAVILLFLSSLIAGLACDLAFRLGWPLLAPVVPLAAGMAWGRGQLGGWLLLSRQPRRWW